MKRSNMLLAVLLATAMAPLAAAAAEPGTWEVWYSVSARTRGARADADLLAGGRLAMTQLRHPSGELSLSLVEVLEHPWKLFWVDPIGPFGEEIKMASVVTLPETTWAALEAARNANAASGRVRHEHWLEQAERPRALDGSFAFIVIGPARGRFRFEVGTDGAVSGVENRMTHHWLPGSFDQFVGAEMVPNGYWFWNNGDEEPFDYEPHTYHAFAAALELLAVPLPSPPGSVVPWPDAVETASGVLGILAPKGRERFAAAPAADTAGRGTPPAAPVRADTLANGDLRLRFEYSQAAPTLRVERETVFSSDGRPASSRARVRLAMHRGGFFEIQAGYRAEALAEDSNE